MTPPAFLQHIIEPYAGEAREWAARAHTDGTGIGNRALDALREIHRAIRDSEWHPGHAKFTQSYADTSAINPVARVPMGTEWVLETWHAIMLSGAATVILRVNGQARASADITTSGMTTTPGLLAKDLHVQGGDEISVETVGLVAAETVQVYLQFKSRPIRTRRHAVNAGQPTEASDRMNDSDEQLDRHSTPSVFQGQSRLGPDTARPAHMPPELPTVR